MEAQELRKALRTVAGFAGSSSKGVPIHGCVTFNGKRMLVCNPYLSVGVPFTTEWQAAVECGTLSAWLSALAPGAEIDSIEPKSHGLVVRAQGSELTLGGTDPTTFPTKVVGRKPSKVAQHVTDVDGLPELCDFLVRASGVDAAQEWSSNVTCVFGKTGLRLYATDNMTMVRLALRCKPSEPLRGREVQLSIETVAAIAKLGMGKGPSARHVKYLFLLDGALAVQFSDGTVLHAALTSGKDTHKQFDEHLNQFDKKSAVPTPPDLANALARVCAASGGSERRAHIVADSSHLVIDGRSNGVRSFETMPLEGHESASALVDPSMLRAAVARTSYMQVTPKALAFHGSSARFIVATLPEEQNKEFFDQ